MDISKEYYSDSSRVSNSSLGWFKDSPKRFKDMLDGKIKTEATAAMKNGTMRHCYILQPEEFKKEYKILDFTVPTSAQQKQFASDYVASIASTPILKASEAFKLNYVTTKLNEEDIAAKGLEMALKLKPYIKWLRGNTTGVETLSWAQLSNLKLMKENIQLHKKAKELLLNNEDSPEIHTHSEFHINWDFIPLRERIKSDVKPRVKIPCKSLIDRIIFDHINKKISLIDIKTTVSISKFKDSFNAYDYGRQMAFYWMAIYWYCKNELKIDIDDYEHETVIVAIQNDTNEIKVLDVPDSIILQKTTEIEQILSEIDWHTTNNLWEYSKGYYEGDGIESTLYDITRES